MSIGNTEETAHIDKAVYVPGAFRCVALQQMPDCDRLSEGGVFHFETKCTRMTNFRNRIKALEYVNAADLTPHPGNWREHGKAQADALKGVLAEVGIAGALLAYRSERQGGALVVIDGHLRKDAAPQQWPVLILDVDDAEADYLLATHDPLAAMATADAGALDALLSSVQSGEAAVQQMLAELAAASGVIPPIEAPEEFPEYGEDIETEYCCPKCGYQWSGRPK